jgi:hypothetical protein
VDRSGRREAVRQTKCGNRWESSRRASSEQRKALPAKSNRAQRTAEQKSARRLAKKGKEPNARSRAIRNGCHAKADTTFCLAPLRPRSWLASPARPPRVFSQTQDQGATVGTGATKPLWPPAAQAEARCCWCDKARCQRSPGTAPQARPGGRVVWAIPVSAASELMRYRYWVAGPPQSRHGARFFAPRLSPLSRDARPVRRFCGNAPMTSTPAGEPIKVYWQPG